MTFNFIHCQPRRWGQLALVLCACAVVASCSKLKPGTDATQVAARVDGEEISVHQINAVLARAQGVTQANLNKAKQDILLSLVDQQIAINLAVKNKLDRSPAVVQAIEEAKRDILARAAVNQLTEALPKPTDDEAKAYYAANPALFSQRRIYSLQELGLPKTTPNMDAVRAKVAAAKSMEELVSWLRASNIPFGANGGSRPAEQIPLEILPQLHQFKDGQIGLLGTNEAFAIMHLVASRTAAVTQEQALPKIKAFLMNQRSSAEVKKQKDLLKAAAKVEYLGEFAGGEAAFKAKAEADAQAALAAQAQAQAKAHSDAQALAQQKAAEQAATQAEAEARSKARANARAQSAGNQGNTNVAPATLEKGIKGLQK